MIEGLKMQGEVTLTTTTKDGTICGEWKSKNTGCIAGLNDLVSAISYAAVEDIAGDINVIEPPITPIYGALGVPGITITSATSGTLSTVSSTLTITSTAGFSTTGKFTIVHGTSLYTVSYTGVGSATTLTGCTIAAGSVTVTSGDQIITSAGPVAVTSQVSTGSPNIIQTGSAVNPYQGVSVGDYVVDVLGDFPTGTTVTAIDYTYTNVTLSANATGTSTANSIMFATSVPSSIDTTLQNEYDRAAAVYAGSTQGSYVTNPQFQWQFQFPINYASAITITEAGTFLLASPTTNGGGDLLNHAFINPPATWGTGQMLMLSVSIGLQP